MICPVCGKEEWTKACKSKPHYQAHYYLTRNKERRKRPKTEVELYVTEDVTSHQEAARLMVEAGAMSRVIDVLDKLGAPGWPPLCGESGVEDVAMIASAFKDADPDQIIEKMRRSELSRVADMLDDLRHAKVMASIPLFKKAVMSTRSLS